MGLERKKRRPDVLKFFFKPNGKSRVESSFVFSPFLRAFAYKIELYISFLLRFSVYANEIFALDAKKSET